MTRFISTNVCGYFFVGGHRTDKAWVSENMGHIGTSWFPGEPNNPNGVAFNLRIYPAIFNQPVDYEPVPAPSTLLS